MDVPAYYEIKEENGKTEEVFEGLREHSVRTAAVGLTLFAKELGSLRDAFVLAAILHDVGKANKRSLKQYRSLKKSKKPGKVSFRCHEVLSAQAVFELGKVSKKFKKMYNLVLYAVLRHHHAMRSVTVCLQEDLVLVDTGELGELVPGLKELVKKKLRPTDVVLYEAKRVENKGKAFIITGFLSLADSVAAFLKRRQDSSGKPGKFVELTLKERGWSTERLEDKIKCLEPEVIETVKKYF